MADFIHYRTSDNRVINVFLTSQTAPAGQTQVNEAHPVFVPTPQETRWTRTGVGTYTNDGPDTSIIIDPPATQTWSFCGVVVALGAGTTIACSWGSSLTSTALTALKAGEIIGFSVTMESARTAGTVTFAFTINGVQQTGAGQTVVIDATNTTTNRLVLATPIAFAAGDRVTITGVSTAAFTPTGNDATIGAWMRDK